MVLDMSKSQTQLLIIMSIALVSLGGSYLLFYFAQDSKGWGTTNNGAFVEPNVNINDIGWQTESDNDVTEQARWWLWVVAEKCDVVCETKLRELRATHILLNKEASRLRRGYTQLQGTIGQDMLNETQSLAGSIAAVSVTDASQLSAGVYIVDPIGNLVFYYSMDHPTKEIQQDLKRLLKVSQIG